jgi:hypothetical protein
MSTVTFLQSVVRSQIAATASNFVEFCMFIEVFKKMNDGIPQLLIKPHGKNKVEFLSRRLKSVILV